ncbi:hypothetical protein Poli38472_003241 [Pythium oligandrum]|uniref:Uncharacterized protein n=1 Tax=Pythium oligandrum TaxID=41045 RepID=A0A8K1FCL2_PYTOL|nr:hypothetical protein Poli38472_003241 [Pythium oligandrum]|eukprot:TMW57316.1 hypothetical protein Poli38472_003241 [Pythium oligandrum]
MYRSVLDASPLVLEFAFDPLRPLHAHEDSTLQWPEYPYKQVVIDSVRSKFLLPKPSIDAAAGALLIARGDVSRAVFEVEQHFEHESHSDGASGTSNTGWMLLEKRFRDERAAFQVAKREDIRAQKRIVQQKLAAIAQKDKEEEERLELEAWKKRQVIRRYDNGRKYDGEGVNQNGVLIPHGHGTMWVPEKESYTGSMGDMKRVPKYIGEWRDGFMHGRGTFYWRNGDAWEGHFCRDEMQGRGVYTFGLGEPDSNDVVDSTRDVPKEQRVRYYDKSQHVCWSDQLELGCRIKVKTNHHYGDPLTAAIRRENVQLEYEVEYVIVQYDESKDRHLVRKAETEDTKWISLHNTTFRVVSMRPCTRLEPE